MAVDSANHVVGMVAYHRHNEERCEMKRLYVKPEARGQQLGEKLVGDGIMMLQQPVLLHRAREGNQDLLSRSVYQNQRDHCRFWMW